MRLEKLIGDRLRQQGWTLSIAESLTGGLVSHLITNVPGSSDYYEGGIVAYSNRAKAQHLFIPLKYIERYGAVSRDVARSMAQGVRQAFGTTFGLSTTGVAGPTGGTSRTPVGTVFIGASDGKKTWVKKVRLTGKREEIKEKAAESALRFLYEILDDSAGRQKISPLSRRLEALRNSRRPKIILLRKASQGIQGRGGHLGIFPASFNPPTKAHLALIKEAMRRVAFNEILVLLDLQAMDKKPVGAAWEDRLKMLDLLFGDDPKFSLGAANRGRFIDKLKPLRKVYPPDVMFTFIVGFDTLARVMDLNYYRNRERSLSELFKTCRFLVANRGEHEQKSFEVFFRQRGNQEFEKYVSFFAVPKKLSSVSSTLVRGRMARGEPVNDLVPTTVRLFIERERLYRKSPR